MDMRKFMSLVLAIAMVVSLCPTQAFATGGETTLDEVASGTCGDNLTWTLTDDGTLTISGTGAMWDYSIRSEAPWDSVKGSIASVVVEQGVTTVGAYAFYYCSSLSSVEMPNSVTTIGAYAFAYCSGLKSIQIPDSVVTIGNNAFRNCTKLEDISLPDTPIAMAASTFDGTAYEEEHTTGSSWGPMYIGNHLIKVRTNALNGLDVREGTITIASGAFSGCSYFTFVTLPDSLVRIGDGAFTNCEKLSSLDIPNGVKYIGAEAFYNTQITPLYIPASVEQIGVPFKTFQNISVSVDENNPVYHSYNGSLIETATKVLLSGTISIPKDGSVTKIGDYAFAQKLSYGGFSALDIPDGVTEIGAYAFNGHRSLSSVTLSASVSTIGEYAFAYCESLDYVYYSGSEQQWNDIVIEKGNDYLCNATVIYVEEPACDGQCGENAYWSFDETTGTLTISGTGAMDEYVGNPSQYPWYAFKDQILEVMVYESVTNVGAYAFSGYPNLQIAVLQVKTIGDHAFDGCTSMNVVSVTGNLTHIGIRAFADTAITAINLSDGLTSIGGEAFMGSKLTSVIIPGTVTECGNGAFQECLDLKTATLGEGLTAVPSYLFMGCTSLETVVIPSTVTSIGWCSFKGCSSLNTVVLPENLTEINADAFGDCVSLTSIKIPVSVERIMNAFGGCTGLKEITFLGDAPEIVGDTTFENVTATVYYPGDNATWTEEVMQSYGGDITWVAVKATSGQCGENAYWSFDEATGTLTIFGTGAMDNYSIPIGGNFAPWHDLRDKVVSIVVEEGITETSAYAFFNMSNLKTVSYSSTVIMVYPNINCKAIEEYIVAEDNPYLTVHDGAVICLLRNAVIAVPPAKTGSFTVPEGITAIEARAFLHCAQITEVILPAGLERIEFNAFYSCDSLMSIEIPASVTFMGLEAFASCDSLTEITFLGDAPTTEEDIFAGVTATAYYPAGNATWTEEVMASYGGNITWVPAQTLSGWVSENGCWYYYVDNVKQTGWIKVNGYWYYMDADGVMQTGWVKVGNSWYYMSAGGAMQTGWVSVGGKWYYMSSGGVMQTGWVSDGGKWYYMASGGAMQTGWVSVGGKWYYMSSGGVMQTGWVSVGGKWYYMASDGAMQTGWLTLGGNKYYLQPGGAMATGLTQIDGVYYCFAADGTMQTGWQMLNGVAHLFGEDGAAATGWYKENNHWYYLDSTGVKQTGWVQVGNNRYYMNTDGVMQTGWLQFDGKWYYLASGGAMQTGWAKVGSYWYYMDANGVMTTGWVKVGGYWYYMNKSGVMQTGWVKVSNYWYYMNSSGVMLTGTQVIDGKTYVFNDNGVWIG